MPAADPRILIIRRRYLGDVVLLGSLVRNLRLHWPAAYLSVLVEKRFADVLSLNPDVNATVVLPSRLAEWPGFLKQLRNDRYTHVLDLDNTEKTALASRLSGAPVRVALHHGTQSVTLSPFYTHKVHDPSELHESRPITEYYLRALEPLNVPATTRDVRLTPKEEDIAELRRFVGSSRRVLLIHPGSRSSMRIWPAERFAEVIDYAQDELAAQVVLVGGPIEEALLTSIRRLVRTHLIPPPEPLPITRFAALARISDALLCHDSGPMHIAAAVGTPVIALYGSQNADLFRPLGNNHALLRPPLPCTTCVAPGRCIREDSYTNLCVQNINVDRVKAAVRAALTR